VKCIKILLLIFSSYVLLENFLNAFMGKETNAPTNYYKRKQSKKKKQIQHVNQRELINQ
jgi:hypothetical protein